MNRLTALLLLLCLSASSATNRIAADDRRDNLQMNRLVRPIASSVNGSVVQVLSGGRLVSLGTVVSKDGYIVTKRSELTGDPIRVRMSDGILMPARVAAVRRRNDLALLRVDADDLEFNPIKFSPNPPPIASFLVSAGRTGQTIGIGVVGVNSRPIRHRGLIGVRLEDGLNGRARVELVVADSGADRAGVEPGDLIVGIDGTKVLTRASVIERLGKMFPGDNVQLTILRRGESSELVTLQMNARLQDEQVIRETPSDTRVNGPRNARLSGFDQVIQHDTVLGPDECGGPVLDLSGGVVGLNIARAGRVVSYLLPSQLVVAETRSMLEEARHAEQ